MSKRTLIIKWSVIFGLVIVLVFFATVYNNIFNTRKTDAENNEYSNVNAVANPQATLDNSVNNDIETNKKTLTVFPKEAPVKNTPIFNYVQNIGGSNDDMIVGSLTIGNKYYLISESNSVDHDFDSDSPKCITVSLVNSSGTLERVFVIEGINPILLDYTVSQNGIVIVYKDPYVKLIKLSLELNHINATEFPSLTDAETANVRVIEDKTYIFTSSGTSLNVSLLNNAFEIIKSKQTVYSGQLSVNAVFTMSNSFRLFLNVESGRSFIKLLELDFDLEAMALKDLSDEFSGNIISVTPFFNDTQYYAMLITSNGGTYLKIYNSSIQCTNMNYVCNAKDVTLINFNNTLLILGMDTAVCCCMHGDVILENMPELKCFNTITDWLITDNKLCILGTNDNSESIVLSYSSSHAVLASVNLGISTPTALLQSPFSIVALLNATASNNGEYTNYGKSDGYIMEIKSEIL